MVLWRMDLLLSKDLETDNNTTAVAMQQRGKHTSITIELLLETMFYTRSVQKAYTEENWGDPVSQLSDES
jgi:hypothetical protein